jgi:signal transduction histidine kinase/CheY-like chemotaxis protein
LKTAYFDLTGDKHAGFEHKDELNDSDMRRYLFALITNDIDSFYAKHSNILEKIKGIVLVPGKSRTTEKFYRNLRIFYFTPEMKGNLFTIAELYLSMLEENIKLHSDYELLKIDTGRTLVQYNRLQGFYESVQEKARTDIQYQNKWTIGALLKLIKFRNTELLRSDLKDFPQTILSFFEDNYFDFRGIALIRNYDTVPEVIVSAGDVTEAIRDKHEFKNTVLWVSVFPLLFENRYEHLLIAAKDRNYYFREYEISFFLLFTEIVAAAYKEKLNEYALIIAKEEAENANQLKTQFIANMNHELRNPLNGILGMIGLLKSAELDEMQYQQVSLLEYSAQSLLRIINDLLDFSSIEKGNLRLGKEAFYSGEILKKMISLFEIPAGNKGLKLKFINNAATEQLLEGDPNRLQQIIINFITNSIKYSEHGEIILQQDIIDEDKNGILCRFSVSDNGIGIPEEKLETIFTEFVQLEDTYTKSQQGLGLGLAIVKSLTRLMNGKIEVSSTHGKGSTFSVTIPFRKVHADNRNFDINNYPSHNFMNKLKILIAEDDVINLFFLEMAFMKMGHSIDKAKNGIEALEFFNKENYDIIFMDIGMPEMNGLKCIKQIRKKNTDIPVVAISGYSSENEINKFISAGFNQILSKPVDINDLKIVIVSALNKK